MIKTIFDQMSSISKPHAKFMTILFTTIMLIQGKINFRNLSRYSEYHEKTFSRWYQHYFDFVEFNRISLNEIYQSKRVLIAAIDCSFISKSGKHTYGLGKFYNSKNSKAEKGLEISTLALVDVTYNTAYNISTRQTPVLNQKDESRVDWYLDHVAKDRHALPENVRYLVADGYYSKTKFINGIHKLGLHQIGKLRYDANLRWLYQGQQKTKGRPKCYEGKVNFNNLEDFEFVEEIDEIKFYTAVVNSAHFKRNLRIVYVLKKINNKISYALLFSTDTHQAPQDIYRFYKARFQIEFLFRDAKQFTGLSDCQARNENTLHFHFNASMTALNLLKLEDRQASGGTNRRVISIISWKIQKSNTHLLERFSSILGLDFTFIKSDPRFKALCRYGAIVA